jgi:hypothetical protein
VNDKLRNLSLCTVSVVHIDRSSICDRRICSVDEHLSAGGLSGI